MLRSLVAAAGVAPLHATGLPGRRRVGIVGAGTAGVSLAWLLDGDCDVVLIEARPEVGGHVRGVDVHLDGHDFVVDLGAQYFHPGPYPFYTALLRSLGLYPPDPSREVGAHALTASITVTAGLAENPRFVSPILPGRAWPLVAPWNLEGLGAFAVGFAAARNRERPGADWQVTLGEWLPTLGLPAAQWEGMLLPWAASLSTGDIEYTRGLSARSVMIFAAKALPANLLNPIVYYTLNPGLGEVLHRLIDQFTSVELLLSAPVAHVSRQPIGAFAIHCEDGRTVFVDELVFASSGGSTRRLLADIPGTRAQRQALEGVEFSEARLALHTDPVYAHANPAYRSFFNCNVSGGYCEASMWLADVLSAPPPETAQKLWKSWVTHRDRLPAEIVHDVTFMHVQPTVATLRAQNRLRGLQGRDGIWFAGGYLYPFDAQETALRSALEVTFGMQLTSQRATALRYAALEAQGGRTTSDPLEGLTRLT